MRRREGRSLLLAGDLTPNAPHKPSQLCLAWRAAAFPALEEEASPQGLQEELFGVQVVLVAVPASPAARTVRASSLDVLDTPWLAGHAVSISTCWRHSQHGSSQCRAAGCRQALWHCRRECEPQHPLSTFPLCPNAPRNRALPPPSRQVLSPALLLFFWLLFQLRGNSLVQQLGAQIHSFSLSGIHLGALGVLEIL